MEKSFLTKHSRFGFTLAEVLITLGIIGVVAAMTLPALVQNYKEKETVARVKKFYSAFSQAYQMAILEHGTMDNWGLEDSQMVEIKDEDSDDEDAVRKVHSEASVEQYDKFFQIMKPYLKNIKYEKNTGDSRHRSKGLVLTDGTIIWGMWLTSSNCAVSENAACGDFYIETNTKNLELESNADSNTRFSFLFYKHKIVPYGLDEATFKNYCLNGTNKTRCTAWVLYNENLDYLHCNDLSWNGKKKCR